MVGKLTATLKEAFPHKEIMTVEMVQDDQRPHTQLQAFCRLLSSQVYTVSLDTPTPDCAKHTLISPTALHRNARWMAAVHAFTVGS